MRVRRLGTLAITVLAAGLVLGAVAAPAIARTGPKTKVKISLEGDVPSGADLTGSILLVSKDGRDRTPIVEATLALQVDGTDAGTVVTDDNGVALVDIPGIADGDHVLTVVFAGDDQHNPISRDRDFSVGGDGDS